MYINYKRKTRNIYKIQYCNKRKSYVTVIFHTFADKYTNIHLSYPNVQQNVQISV